MIRIWGEGDDQVMVESWRLPAQDGTPARSPALLRLVEGNSAMVLRIEERSKSRGVPVRGCLITMRRRPPGLWSAEVSQLEPELPMPGIQLQHQLCPTDRPGEHVAGRTVVVCVECDESSVYNWGQHDDALEHPFKRDRYVLPLVPARFHPVGDLDTSFDSSKADNLETCGVWLDPDDKSVLLAGILTKDRRAALMVNVARLRPGGSFVWSNALPPDVASAFGLDPDDFEVVEGTRCWGRPIAPWGLDEESDREG